MPEQSINPTPNPTTKAPKNEKANKAVEASKVVSVNDDNFYDEVIKASKTQTVLVEFSAQWCGPCCKMKQVLENFAKAHPEVKVVSIDTDKSPITTEKYQANNLPYFVVFKNESIQKDTIQGSTKLENLERIVGIILPPPPPKEGDTKTVNKDDANVAKK